MSEKIKSKERSVFNKMRVWAFLGVAGLVLVGTLVLAAGKPAANVQLRATFLDSFEVGEGDDKVTIPCTIMNDDQGPYVTVEAGQTVRVWISPDNGDLHFMCDHHSARSLKVIFPYFNSPSCGGWLPDTTGLYPEIPDTPIDYLKFRTINLSGYYGPKLNLLTMPPDTTLPVRLEVVICTTNEHFYFLAYNEPNLDAKRGIVDITATADNSGKLIKWLITPQAGTSDIAYIKRWINNKVEFCSYTEALMPFRLILERL